MRDTPWVETNNNRERIVNGQKTRTLHGLQRGEEGLRQKEESHEPEELNLLNIVGSFGRD